MSDPPRVLLLPGWMNSGPSHWQSRWEARHGFERVEQADWLWPRRGDWMARLDEVLLASEQVAVLAAHSLGCQLVAAWALHSRHTARVQGALLVAPPDVERSDFPPQLVPWRPIVRARLPFAAQVIYSEDDPYGSTERSQADVGPAAPVARGRPQGGKPGPATIRRTSDAVDAGTDDHGDTPTLICAGAQDGERVVGHRVVGGAAQPVDRPVQRPFLRREIGPGHEPGAKLGDLAALARPRRTETSVAARLADQLVDKL